VSGKIRITFQFIGYEPVTREVEISAGEITEVDVGLVMMVSEIDQVVVSANRIEQKIAELSVSVDIIKTPFLSGNHITDAQELANRTPGIEVLDGQASIREGAVSAMARVAGCWHLLMDCLTFLLMQETSNGSFLHWKIFPRWK